MQNLSLRKLMALLGDEFERVLLAILALVVALLLVSGIQGEGSRPAPPAAKYNAPQFFNDAVAWLFTTPMDPATMGDAHAFKTHFPDGWKPNVRPSLPKPPDPIKIEDPIANPANPNGNGNGNNTDPPPLHIEPDPVAVVVPPEPPPVKPPPVKPPAVPPPPPPPPKNYLSFKGFVKSPNNHTLALVVQEQGADRSPAYLELGQRFNGMTVVSVDKYRIVLQRAGGERLILNVGERLELRELDRRRNSP